MNRTASEARSQREGGARDELACQDVVHDLRQDVGQYLRQYAREQPEMAALWCLGIGFVLGWKLKPW
jgi:hypothetical protein